MCRCTDVRVPLGSGPNGCCRGNHSYHLEGVSLNEQDSIYIIFVSFTDSYTELQKRTLIEIEDMKRKMELVELGIPLGLICPSATNDKAMPTKAMPPIKTFLGKFSCIFVTILDKFIRKPFTELEADKNKNSIDAFKHILMVKVFMLRELFL